MQGHWLKRCYLMCNEMHGHSAAKCYHCLSRRFLRTSENWKQKSSERPDPQQTNLMLKHWLKHYKLKWNENQGQSATKCYHCLSMIFTRTSQRNWKQKPSEGHNPQITNLMTGLRLKRCEVKRNAQTVSCKMSSSCVKEVLTDITQLETKIIKDTIQQKINFMQHNEPRTWKRSETEFTQSQLKHYHCSSEIPIYITKLESKNTTQDSA